MVPQPLLLPRTVRILVVEDEVLIRALIAEELRLEGFSVIEADRADDALTYIKAGAQVDLSIRHKVELPLGVASWPTFSPPRYVSQRNIRMSVAMEVEGPG